MAWHEVPQHTYTFSKRSSPCVCSVPAILQLQLIFSDSCPESLQTFILQSPSSWHTILETSTVHPLPSVCQPSRFLLNFCLSSQESCSTIPDPTLHSSLNPVMLYSQYAKFHRQRVEGVYFGRVTFSTMLSPPLFLIMYLPLFITTEHKADAFIKHLFKQQFPE